MNNERENEVRMCALSCLEKCLSRMCGNMGTSQPVQSLSLIIKSHVHIHVIQITVLL